MASVIQTRLHCVNQMGKTHYKPLAARIGRGTAWARHAMCESALRGSHMRAKESFAGLRCYYTGCPTRYRTRHLFNNFTTNEDIATKFEADLPHCVRNVTS